MEGKVIWREALKRQMLEGCLRLMAQDLFEEV